MRSIRAPPQNYFVENSNIRCFTFGLLYITMEAQEIQGRSAKRNIILGGVPDVCRKENLSEA
jgi:hypothetical protein